MELCAGVSLARAGRDIGVTYETARSYLKSIFSKSETNRQAQLVALLSQVTSLVGAVSALRYLHRDAAVSPRQIDIGDGKVAL